VDNQANKKAAEGFAKAFASSLGASLTEAAGETVMLTVVDSPNLTTREGEPVHFRLTASGGIRGQCFVELYEPQVAKLGSKVLRQPAAAYQDEHADALAEVVLTASNGLTDALGAEHGSFSFKVDRVEDLAFGGMLVVPLSATLEDGSAIPMLLYFDGTLLSTLRVKPDAENTATEQGNYPIDAANLKLVMDVELVMSLRFGQRQLPLREVLELNSGSVIELDRRVDEPVELLLDGKVIARGEAVVVDGNYGLRVTEVPQPVASYLGR
jgi:flagellar motor switch protein FliN/FliY